MRRVMLASLTLGAWLTFRAIDDEYIERLKKAQRDSIYVSSEMTLAAKWPERCCHPWGTVVF
jgi:hypothetical protein